MRSLFRVAGAGGVLGLVLGWAFGELQDSRCGVLAAALAACTRPSPVADAIYGAVIGAFIVGIVYVIVWLIAEAARAGNEILDDRERRRNNRYW